MSKLKREHEEAVIKKVSRRQEEQGHGGAWKVAFADFVLALMCLFLVMWLLASREQETLEQALKSGGTSQLAAGSASRIELLTAPRGSLIPREPIPGQPTTDRPNSQVKSTGQPSALDGRRQRYDSLADLNTLAARVAALSQQAGLSGHVQTAVTPYGLRVTLHDTDDEGMFDRGSTVLAGRFERLLRQMGGMFADVDNPMLIVGHTDAVQFRGNADGFSNWTLSSHRAMAARRFLQEGGMAESSVLQVVGMADRAPLDRRHPDAGVNRRIELMVLTSAQAEAIAAMYGAPATPGAQPGIATALPTAEALGELRKGLLSR